jgi:hypothetical protein
VRGSSSGSTPGAGAISTVWQGSGRSRSWSRSPSKHALTLAGNTPPASRLPPAAGWHHCAVHAARPQCASPVTHACRHVPRAFLPRPTTRHPRSFSHRACSISISSCQRATGVRQPAGEACCWLVGVEFPHRRSRMNEPMKRVNLPPPCTCYNRPPSRHNPAAPPSPSSFPDAAAGCSVAHRPPDSSRDRHVAGVRTNEFISSFVVDSSSEGCRRCGYYLWSRLLSTCCLLNASNRRPTVHRRSFCPRDSTPFIMLLHSG